MQETAQYPRHKVTCYEINNSVCFVLALVSSPLYRTNTSSKKKNANYHNRSSLIHWVSSGVGGWSSSTAGFLLLSELTNPCPVGNISCQRPLVNSQVKFSWLLMCGTPWVQQNHIKCLYPEWAPLEVDSACSEFQHRSHRRNDHGEWTLHHGLHDMYWYSSHILHCALLCYMFDTYKKKDSWMDWKTNRTNQTFAQDFNYLHMTN